MLALTCVHVAVDIDRFASEGDRVSALSRGTVIVKEIVYHLDVLIIASSNKLKIVTPQDQFLTTRQEMQ